MNNQPENQPCQDSIVEANVELLRQRSRVGESKYGVTLSESKLSDPRIIQHAIEEALDLANYLQLLASQVPTPQPDSQSTERPTMLLTLMAWCVGHPEIEPKWVDNGYEPAHFVFQTGTPKNRDVLDLAVFPSENDSWKCEILPWGGDFQEVQVGTPADLIELLNRLLPTK